jgi:hypothetical protein
MKQITDKKILEIARCYLNASGKPNKEDDVLAIPHSFDVYREYEVARRSGQKPKKRRRPLGRTITQLQHYLVKSLGWTERPPAVRRQRSIFE